MKGDQEDSIDRAHPSTLQSKSLSSMNAEWDVEFRESLPSVYLPSRPSFWSVSMFSVEDQINQNQTKPKVPTKCRSKFLKIYNSRPLDKFFWLLILAAVLTVFILLISPDGGHEETKRNLNLVYNNKHPNF